MIAFDPGRNPDVLSARRMIADLLRKDGVESAELDARILVGHVLGLDHARLSAAQSRVLTGTEIEAIAALVTRRLDREPVARILGQKEFWGLPLHLSADTLVPRPETEIVVEAALAAIERISPQARRQALHVADLGTGSGAILLALLTEMPSAFAIGTDLSLAALATARGNAILLDLAARCAFVASHYGAALNGCFDLAVSNPPYIATADISGLPPEVRRHDPRLALDGGTDGLDAYRAIAGDAKRLVRPGGLLVVEVGAGQAGPVTAILEKAGLASAASPRPDLAGIARAVTFQRKP